MPARSTNDPWPCDAPATPMTRARFETRPSRDAEDDGAQRARPAGPVPALARGDVARPLGVPDRPPRRRRRHCRSRSRRSQIAACSRSSAAIASTSGDALGRVQVLLVALERQDEIADRVRPEEPGDEHDRPDAKARAGAARARRRRATRSLPAQTSAWRRSLPAIDLKASARRGVLLDRRPARRTARSRRARASGSQGSGRRRSGGIARIVAVAPCSATMAAVAGRPTAVAMPLPPLRWFNAADVVAAMPALEERLRLAEQTMVALAQPGASELPPKIAIHPRPDGSFVHAMPAHLRGADPRRTTSSA